MNGGIVIIVVARTRAELLVSGVTERLHGCYANNDKVPRFLIDHTSVPIWFI
jgi:hypothetical protein